MTFVVFLPVEPMPSAVPNLRVVAAQLAAAVPNLRVAAAQVAVAVPNLRVVPARRPLTRRAHYRNSGRTWFRG